jgi:hypothetical protein
MLEELAVDKHLVNTLSGDATLSGLIGSRIWKQLAPENSATPYLVFYPVAINDIPTVGQTGRIYSSALYVIEAVSDVSYASLRTILTRIDALYNGVQNTVVDGLYVSSASREETVSQIETVGDFRYYRIGGRYRFFVSK